MLTAAAAYTWAQIGHYEVVSSERHVYAQWANGTEPSVDDADTAPVTLGTYRLFTTSWSGGVFTMKEGTITRAQVSLNWTPTAAEISSEVVNIATQMMGESADHVNFDQNRMRVNGGAYQDFDGALRLNDPAWYSAAGVATSFDTWDDTC